jgi:hypothetical protein
MVVGFLGAVFVALLKLVRLRLGDGKTVNGGRWKGEVGRLLLLSRLVVGLCYSLRQSRHHWLVVNRVAMAELAADVCMRWVAGKVNVDEMPECGSISAPEFARQACRPRTLQASRVLNLQRWG